MVVTPSNIVVDDYMSTDVIGLSPRMPRHDEKLQVDLHGAYYLSVAMESNSDVLFAGCKHLPPLV